MTRTTKKAAAKLNTAIAGAVKRFAPPESLTVDEWADKHRRLSPESSAEAGPWRTKRTSRSPCGPLRIRRCTK